MMEEKCRVFSAHSVVKFGYAFIDGPLVLTASAPGRCPVDALLLHEQEEKAEEQQYHGGKGGEEPARKVCREKERNHHCVSERRRPRFPGVHDMVQNPRPERPEIYPAPEKSEGPCLESAGAALADGMLDTGPHHDDPDKEGKVAVDVRLAAPQLDPAYRTLEVQKIDPPDADPAAEAERRHGDGRGLPVRSPEAAHHSADGLAQ